MLDLTPISTDERFWLAYYQGQSDRLVLSCSGVGTKRGQMPPFEFMNAASGDGAHHRGLRVKPPPPSSGNDQTCGR